MVCAIGKGSDQQSEQNLCYSLEYSTRVKLLTEHHLEFLSLKRGCTGSSESTQVKMPLCWKTHVAARIVLDKDPDQQTFFEEQSGSVIECST